MGSIVRLALFAVVICASCGGSDRGLYDGPYSFTVSIFDDRGEVAGTRYDVNGITAVFVPGDVQNLAHYEAAVEFGSYEAARGQEVVVSEVEGTTALQTVVLTPGMCELACFEDDCADIGGVIKEAVGVRRYPTELTPLVTIACSGPLGEVGTTE